MVNILQELMPLTGVPLEEAEIPTPQMSNLNLDGEYAVIFNLEDLSGLKKFYG